MKTNIRKTITDYENAGFTGVDVNLSVSLFEYGLIWHENDQDGDTKFIYGVSFDDNLNYTAFDFGFYNENSFKELIEDSWFDLKGILSFGGVDLNTWLKLSLGQRIFDCIAYHGYENIFGSSYNYIEIKDI